MCKKYITVAQKKGKKIVIKAVTNRLHDHIQRVSKIGAGPMFTITFVELKACIAY